MYARAMVKSIAASFVLLFISPVVHAAPSYQSISFDDFTSRELLTSLPLTFRVPNDLVMVREKPGITRGLWWVPRRVQEQVATSMEVPQDVGYFLVRLSTTVGYVSERDLFVGAEQLTDKQQRALKTSGVSTFTTKRVEVAGRPALVHESEILGGRVYGIYLPLGIETHVLSITYAAPNNEPDTEGVWSTFVNALLESNQPLHPDASRASALSAGERRR